MARWFPITAALTIVRALDGRHDVDAVFDQP
jgi:hypothetical protein